MSTFRAFYRDRRAASAVEFSIVALPFIFTLLAILQMSIYYMTQSALDAGVMQTADALVNSFYTSAVPTAPSASSLKTQIAQGAGGMVKSSTLLADLQPLQNLTTAPVAIGLNPPNIGTPRKTGPLSLLVLRAQSGVTAFAPGFSQLMVVRSSAVLRRQDQ